jgi:antitoxin CcdA
MKHRTSIILDDLAYDFLKQEAGKNASAYINNILLQKKQAQLAQQIARSNLEEANNLEYQQQLEEFDNLISDNLYD